MVTKHDSRTPKKVWYYSTKDGSYISEGEASPDPIDGKSWLVPSNATTIEPPSQKKGWKSSFDGDKWITAKS
jgi:hypothetical protein